MTRASATPPPPFATTIKRNPALNGDRNGQFSTKARPSEGISAHRPARPRCGSRPREGGDAAPLLHVSDGIRARPLAHASCPVDRAPEIAAQVVHALRRELLSLLV